MSRNQELFAAACRHIPGGVNSPVRADFDETIRKAPAEFDFLSFIRKVGSQRNSKK